MFDESNSIRFCSINHFRFKLQQLPTSGVLADSHDYCACQQWSNGPVDHVATAKVAAKACFGYVWGPAEHLADSQTIWNAHSPGPRYEGQYVSSVSQPFALAGLTALAPKYD
ncbi:secreted in xylem 5 [Colletotrichum camelliae]|nr:secreted in xylem 5 [Colletotrichum camelliae]